MRIVSTDAPRILRSSIDRLQHRVREMSNGYGYRIDPRHPPGYRVAQAISQPRPAELLFETHARRWFTPVAPVFALLPLLAACSPDSSAPSGAPPPPPTPVGVVEVSDQPTNPGMTFVGRVEAINNVDIVARVEGFLVQRAFTEGQAVKTGDLLFVLEKGPLQAALDSAQANLSSAQASANNAKVQADRARTLLAQKTISQANLDDRVAAEDEAQAAVQQANAAVEQAQINLSYTEIHAPFDGRVGTTNFSIGALVGPNTGPLTTIVSQDPIYVTFPVSDRSILEFTQGDRSSATVQDIAVRLTLSNNMVYPDLGTIDFTGIKVDPNTDTVPIRATFPNPKNTLLDGQFVQVTAENKTPVQALLVPQKAILTDQSGNYVLVVEAGNKVAQRAVTQGQTVGSDVVIQAGLKAGDVVVTDGLQRIRPGQLVDPQPIAAPDAAAPPATPPKGN